MKTRRIEQNAVAMLAGVLMITGLLTSCNSANASGNQAGDNENQAVEYEYIVEAKSFDLGYGDLAVADTSYSGENAYLLYSTTFNADEDKENVQKIVIVDKDMVVVREIPYTAGIQDLHISEVKAAVDGSYWTVEAPKAPESEEWYLRHYDEFGTLLLSVRPGDLAEDAAYGFSIAAINSLGQVYVTIDSGREDTGRDLLALIDQSGVLVRYWDDFTYQLSATILDDDTLIVRVIPEALGTTPNRKSNLYEISPDGDLLLLGDVGDIEAEAHSNGFQPWMFSGVGREIFFEGDFILYRLSLDEMKVEAVAEYSTLADSSEATPQVDSLRVDSEDLMYGLMCDGSKLVAVTFKH